MRQRVTERGGQTHRVLDVLQRIDSGNVHDAENAILAVVCSAANAIERAARMGDPERDGAGTQGQGRREPELGRG